MQDVARSSPTSHSVDQRQAIGYRADIDGLRALAVLPIVAFHLGFVEVGGGYIGVDIFFVISGYLIGGNLLRQILDRRYSISDFYVRRFRRIMPAIVMLLLAATAGVCLLLLPKATADYGKSLMATALFSSNFYFWSSSGYFSSASDTMPLLHTWSLAVEEQYYLVFPIIILSVYKLGERTTRFTIVALTLLSLMASIACLEAFPTGTFYLLPTRIWELLLGLLAVFVSKKLVDTTWRREATAWLGLFLIAGPMLLYSPTTPFPGIAAVPPCLGTAMLIVAGANGGSSLSRLLSLKPIVFFGLISYSLYLWHWPVIVLLKQGLLLNYLPLSLRLVAFVLSTGLAWVSWRTIERPFRNPAIKSRAILIGTAASLGVLCLIGAVLVKTDGLRSRYSPEIVRIAAIQDDSSTNDFREGRCFISSAYTFASFDKKTCLQGDGKRLNILLMGDSHAAHLWSGLQRRYPNINFLQATASGCKPVISRPADAAARCEQMMRFLFDQYLPSHPVDWVILSGSWDPIDALDVAKTLDWLRDRRFHVVLAGPIVRYNAPLPQVLAIALSRHDPALVARVRQPGGSALDVAFHKLAVEHGALYFSPYGALCRSGVCRVTDESGMPLQFDYGHLTAQGSFAVAAAFPMPKELKLSPVVPPIVNR